ncbi:putative hexapeptide transferase family protein [marine gamma proteobacterium HTCC2143]|uniref:Putative hexapeptide transferase family protein n=1 Tax=marine gamma proteobacterium HTCC2143 TaxID=247633 RepID=A0YGH0_9GAMM|nr:putative hexapeptide transferase family protein [marine gamma proteobacterium HTCC2143]
MLFDDKYICEQLCKSIDVRLPESYGIIDGDDDYRFDLRKIFDNADVQKVIIKPIRGHAGRDIYIVKRKGSKLLVQSDACEYDLQKFFLKGQFIVQAVIEQDKAISDISSSSINTIRVVTMLSKSGDVIVVSSSMRFGIGASYVDNWSAGGIAVGIDHQTGTLGKIAYDKHGKEYSHHPVSGIELAGYSIPKWELVLESAKTVQNAFPYYKLLGMDIALSDDGPVLIEVNANSDIVFQEQTSGPLLKNRRVAEAFDEYNLLVNSLQRDVLKNR